jgi:hypothetical protein
VSLGLPRKPSLDDDGEFEFALDLILDDLKRIRGAG